MKIRIEGCTQEALGEHSDYLTVGKEYEVLERPGGSILRILDDNGARVSALFCNPDYGCAHLPEGAAWAKVEWPSNAQSAVTRM